MDLVGGQLSSILERRKLFLASDMDAMISGRDICSHMARYFGRDSMPEGIILIGLWNKIETCLSSWEDKLTASIQRTALGMNVVGP